MHPEIQKILHLYPIRIMRHVNWGDMDAARHVNNTVYLRWGESGRVAYFKKLYPRFPEQKDHEGSILAKLDASYKIPLTYPDTVVIGTRAIEVRADRFLLESTIVSIQHKKVAALVTGTLVYYDHLALKKLALPQKLPEIIRTFENEKHDNPENNPY